MSLEIKSRILPGVAMTMWTLLSSLKTSDFRSVPPVVTMTPNFLYFEIATAVEEVCRASSLVGTMAGLRDTTH